MAYKDRSKQLEYLREYNKKYQKERYLREKGELIKKLGGKCVMCGSTKELEFDHKNRSEKSFAITSKLHSKALDSELRKCQLLCHSCHLKKTYEDLGWNNYSDIPKEERGKYRSRVFYQKNRDRVNKERRDRRKTQNALQKRSTGGST